MMAQKEAIQTLKLKNSSSFLCCWSQVASKKGLQSCCKKVCRCQGCDVLTRERLTQSLARNRRDEKPEFFSSTSERGTRQSINFFGNIKTVYRSYSLLFIGYNLLSFDWSMRTRTELSFFLNPDCTHNYCVILSSSTGSSNVSMYELFQFSTAPTYPPKVRSQCTLKNGSHDIRSLNS